MREKDYSNTREESNNNKTHTQHTAKTHTTLSCGSQTYRRSYTWETEEERQTEGGKGWATQAEEGEIEAGTKERRLK